MLQISTWQHTTLKRDRHPCPSGIWTRNPSKRETADRCLRPHGHWNWITYYLIHIVLNLLNKTPIISQHHHICNCCFTNIFHTWSTNKLKNYTSTKFHQSAPWMIHQQSQSNYQRKCAKIPCYITFLNKLPNKQYIFNWRSIIIHISQT